MWTLLFIGLNSSILVFHTEMRPLCHGSRENTIKMNMSSVFPTLHIVNRKKQWGLYAPMNLTSIHTLLHASGKLSLVVSTKQYFWVLALFSSFCHPFTPLFCLFPKQNSLFLILHPFLVVCLWSQEVDPTTVVHLYMERRGLIFPIWWVPTAR